MKRSKKYIEAAAKVDAKNVYSPLAAVKLAKETSVTKYDASVEVALVLGVDPKKADQAIRSTVNLPHGTGKTVRVWRSTRRRGTCSRSRHRRCG
jgi:large subunit ribosomal protein L1